jgi:hypothetical protein
MSYLAAGANILREENANVEFSLAGESLQEA